MPRRGEEARKRLLQADLELFAQHGFDGTTAAQIAERAGVTERTFFRHFADKREVLFVGQEVLTTKLTDAIGRVPADRSPIETLRRAFVDVIDIFEQNRRFSEPRQRIVAATPALREREVAKHAALVQSTAAALVRRGVAPRRDDLAAQAGLAVLGYALDAWLAEPQSRLADHLDRAFAELQELAADTAS